MNVFPEEIEKKNKVLYLVESGSHQNAAPHNIVRVFAACKSYIKGNKNVTAHLNHVKYTRDMHRLRHRRVVVKGLLAADWSKL